MVIFSEEADILDIKAFHLYLKKDTGVLVTYPNDPILQKEMVISTKNSLSSSDNE